MTTRFSRENYKRQGSMRRVVNVSDEFVSTFARSLGAEKSAEVSSIIFGSDQLSTGAVNPDLFGVTKAFFETRGQSKSSAETLAILFIDAARIAGVTVFSLLDDVKVGKIKLDGETTVLSNMLRHPSAKSRELRTNTNYNCLRKRLIVA